jgi:hypothetical protein
MEENDRLLLELAQRCKGLEPMLDAVFSFLKRKSDLYVEQAPGDRVGFPPGEAQKIVMKCFNKFASAGGPAPDKKALEALGTRLQGDGSTPQRPDAKQLQKTAPKPSVTQDCSDASHPPVAAPLPHPASFPPTSTSNLPHYNGAALETYSWSQTLTDVTLSLPLCPPCSAKNLSVTIEKSRISVQRRDGAEASLALQGDLPHDVDVSESLWNVDGNILVAFPYECCNFVFFLLPSAPTLKLATFTHRCNVLLWQSNLDLVVVVGS